MSEKIHVTDVKFKISAKGLEKAVEAMGFEDFDQLEVSLGASGWVVTLDPKGNVSDIDCQAAGLAADINEVLPYLAPFVKAGSYIHMEDDGAKKGTWDFNGTRCLCKGFAAEAGYAEYLKELKENGGIEDADEEEEDEDEKDADDDDDDEDDDEDEDEPESD